MRATYHPLWPALSHHFGLYPWHVREGLLSIEELNQYVEQLADLQWHKG